MTTSVSCSSGFLGIQTRLAEGQGKPFKHFDWIKAARILRERKPAEAVAGLDGDFDCTCATIYENGQPVLDSGCFHGSSNWGIPTLVIYQTTDCAAEEIECWVEGHVDPHIWWPPEALNELTPPTPDTLVVDKRILDL